MRKAKKLKIVIAIVTLLILGFVIGIFFVADALRDIGVIVSEEDKLVSCTDLGCPKTAKYVGSANSNVYHKCDCNYALAILPENRLCFDSANEAELQEYRSGSCIS